MPSLLRFRPYLRPMVWGGRHLGEILGKWLPTDESYGEAWEVSDHASHQSVVASGPEAGLTLREILQRDPQALLGSADVSGFPWLVKYLDARDWLSVQVHPDDDSVARLWPGECGKTEAWFVLSARPGSRIYAGLLAGVDERGLRHALESGNVAECLHSFQPRPGDCLYLPAGTVHAVGGGVLIAEVQQTSDATFRLFDWNRRDAAGRSRTLHIDQAMACIDWSAGPVRPIPAQGYPQAPGQFPSANTMQPLVRSRYFHLDYLCSSQPFSLAGVGRLQTVVVLHGRGRIQDAHEQQDLRQGETIVLPAALGPTQVEPIGPVGVLVATLPDPQQPSTILRAA